MSDAQKLKDAVSELHKAKQAVDDKVKEAAEKVRLARKDSEGQSNRQY